jgi:hypothetical protein
LLQNTPLSRISDHDLQDLQQRHGIERLLQAADIAAETWRRKREEPRNPGGYLQALCASLVVPEWYVPIAERQKRAKALHQQKEAIASQQKAIEAQEEAASAERNALWNGLAVEEREHFRSLALAGMPAGGNPAEAVILILAKIRAWEARQVSGCS